MLAGINHRAGVALGLGAGGLLRAHQRKPRQDPEQEILRGRGFVEGGPRTASSTTATRFLRLEPEGWAGRAAYPNANEGSAENRHAFMPDFGLFLEDVGQPGADSREHYHVGGDSFARVQYQPTCIPRDATSL